MLHIGSSLFHFIQKNIYFLVSLNTAQRRGLQQIKRD